MKDLIVLVADKDTQFTLQGLFSRNQSLKIRDISQSNDIFVHPQRDPGCYNQCVNYLRAFKEIYDYGLVIFDHDGSGQDSKSREEIESELEQELAQSGWNERIAVIVIEPELESWVWSDSPHVGRILGWEEQPTSLNDWLVNQNFLEPEQIKPTHPKEAMDEAIRQVGKAHSSSIFLQLAEKVSLNRCQDNSFLKLKTILQRWFS